MAGGQSGDIASSTSSGGTSTSALSAAFPVVGEVAEGATAPLLAGAASALLPQLTGASQDCSRGIAELLALRLEGCADPLLERRGGTPEWLGDDDDAASADEMVGVQPHDSITPCDVLTSRMKL